jgi:hypothetical protein
LISSCCLLQKWYCCSAYVFARGGIAALGVHHTRYCRLLLYSHGAELFADDEAAIPMLHRHLLRSVAAECVDALLRCLAVDSTAGIEEAEEDGEGGGQLFPLVDAAAGPLSAAQRAAIMKQLPPDVRPAISAAADKLSGSNLEVSGGVLTRLDAAACWPLLPLLGRLV